MLKKNFLRIVLFVAVCAACSADSRQPTAKGDVVVFRDGGSMPCGFIVCPAEPSDAQ